MIIDVAATGARFPHEVCASHTRRGTAAPTIDMPADGKGAKRGDVMTKTHATGYGMRNSR